PGDPLADYPTRIELAVVWGEMDSYRHVNNVVYFRYFESARLEYFQRMGWIAFDQETGIGPILAATQARFRKPLTYPDTIVVAARVRAVGDDRITMEHIVWSRRLGAVAPEGHGPAGSYHSAAGQ